MHLLRPLGQNSSVMDDPVTMTSTQVAITSTQVAMTLAMIGPSSSAVLIDPTSSAPMQTSVQPMVTPLPSPTPEQPPLYEECKLVSPLRVVYNMTLGPT